MNAAITMMQAKQPVEFIQRRCVHRITFVNPAARRLVATGSIRGLAFIDFGFCTSPFYGAYWHVTVLMGNNAGIQLCYGWVLIENKDAWPVTIRTALFQVVRTAFSQTGWAGFSFVRIPLHFSDRKFIMRYLKAMFGPWFAALYVLPWWLHLIISHNYMHRFCQM